MPRRATNRTLLSIPLVALGVLLLTPALTFGQQLKTGITVTPGVINAKVSQQAPTSQTVLTIRNNYDTPVSLTAQLRDIDQSTTQLLPGGELDSALAQVFSLSETQFTITPRSDYKLTLQANYLEQLTPGGHYATLVLTQNGSTGANLSVQSAVSIVVFLTNTDGVKESLAIDEFSAPSSVFKVAGSAKIALKNDGNVHTVPRGFVRVQKLDGTVLSEGVLNVGSQLVLPGNTYSADLRLKAIAATWYPQRVTTQLQYRPDGSSQATVAVNASWYVPPIFVMLLTASLVTCGVAIWLFIPRLYKHRKNRRSVKASQPSESLMIPSLGVAQKQKPAVVRAESKDTGVKIAVRVGKPVQKIRIKHDE